MEKKDSVPNQLHRPFKMARERFMVVFLIRYAEAARGVAIIKTRGHPCDITAKVDAEIEKAMKRE